MLVSVDKNGILAYNTTDYQIIASTNIGFTSTNNISYAL